MKVFRPAVLALLALASASAADLAAQGIPRTARRLGQAPTAATRLMVANPYTFNVRDSATSVAIADGLRDKLQDVAGRDYAVIPDSIMNSALTQFGYQPNAILTPPLALQLAKQLPGTKGVVTSTLQAHDDDQGRYTVNARFFPTLEDAGVAVEVVQQPNEKPEALGARVAEQLKPAVEAFEDAKACSDQIKTKPDDAMKAAEKAVKAYPNHGGAHLCMAQLLQAKGAPRAQVVEHLEAAAKGDPQSLTVWSLLAENHQEMAKQSGSKADSAKVVADMRQMLRVAPTNQKMRENIFKYLLQTGNSTVAVQVADEGLRLDPYNWDLYDLKSNACLFQSNFPCAIDALEKAYEVDSTRADSLFYSKIAVAAAQQPDTLRLAKWAGRGAAKYPNNADLLGYANQAYVLTGKLDSSVAITRKLIQLDPTQVDPALAAVQGLANAKRLPEAQEFVDVIMKNGDADQKDKLGGILVAAAAPLVQQQPQDFKTAADLTRQCLAVSSPASRYAPTCNLILGVSAFQLAAQMDPDTEKTKSCDGAKRENELVLESEKALTAGKAVSEQTAAQYLGFVGQFKTRTAQMIKAYCK